MCMSVEEYQFFSVVAIVIILLILCSDIYRLRTDTEKEHRGSNIVSIVLASLILIGLQVGLIIATYCPEYGVFE